MSLSVVAHLVMYVAKRRSNQYSLAPTTSAENEGQRGRASSPSGAADEDEEVFES